MKKNEEHEPKVIHDGKGRHSVLLFKGKKEPDIYKFTFGLSMKAYTVESLKKYLNHIPDDAYLSDIHYREDFKDGDFTFTRE